MEFGASVAYQRIDAKVEQTLRKAAEVLKGIERSTIEEEKGYPKITTIEHKSVTVSSFCPSSISSEPQPKATIRTPRDACKTRKFYFPKAKITSNPKSPATMSPDPSSFDSVTTAPDSLFPSAVYIPAHRGGSQIQISPFPRSTIPTSESSAASAVSTYRQHVEKLAVEPLEDIKHLKCRGQKKSKPDSMFPRASYNPGTGKNRMAFSPSSCSTLSSLGSSTEFTHPSSDSASLIYQPMEFLSKDGRVKMLLQPLEEPSSHGNKPKDTEFPIVPKQLESCQNLKVGRTKFSTKLSIGQNTIDLSGIFSGSQLRKKDLTKLVINGQTYSI